MATKDPKIEIGEDGPLGCKVCGKPTDYTRPTDPMPDHKNDEGDPCRGAGYMIEPTMITTGSGLVPKF